MPRVTDTADDCRWNTRPCLTMLRSRAWQGVSEIAGGSGTGHFQIGSLNGASNTGIAITGLPDGSAQLLALGTDDNVYHNIGYGNATWQGLLRRRGWRGDAATFNGAFAVRRTPRPAGG